MLDLEIILSKFQGSKTKGSKANDARKEERSSGFPSFNEFVFKYLSDLSYGQDREPIISAVTNSFVASGLKNSAFRADFYQDFTSYLVEKIKIYKSISSKRASKFDEIIKDVEDEFITCGIHSLSGRIVDLRYCEWLITNSFSANEEKYELQRLEELKQIIADGTESQRLRIEDLNNQIRQLEKVPNSLSQYKSSTGEDLSKWDLLYKNKKNNFKNLMIECDELYETSCNYNWHIANLLGELTDRQEYRNNRQLYLLEGEIDSREDKSRRFWSQTEEGRKLYESGFRRPNVTN
jgi:hypothetical protein